MSRADRIFRRPLWLFPADFRGDFGDDMAATFNDQRRDVLAVEIRWRHFDSGGMPDGRTTIREWKPAPVDESDTSRRY